MTQIIYFLLGFINLILYIFDNTQIFSLVFGCTCLILGELNRLRKLIDN
jgi:hypothetical protein